MSRQLTNELGPWFVDPKDDDADPKPGGGGKTDGTREGEVDPTRKESRETGQKES